MQSITVPKDTLLTKSGESKKPLYKIIKGEVLIFILKKNTVIPLGKIKPGDFIGELSFLITDLEVLILLHSLKRLLSYTLKRS